MICINDDDRLMNFEEARNKVILAFDRILPEKSGYEV